jgi:hypothetical protein
VSELLGALLRGIERDAVVAARQSVLYDHRGREIQYAATVAVDPTFRGETATSVDDIYGLQWMNVGWRYNPDMLALKKGGLKIYHEMRLDDQAKAALHLKKSAIVHPGWKIEGDDDQLREFVEHVFSAMDGTIEDTVRSILSAYDYGFSLHEKVYTYLEDGPYRGKIGIKSLKQKSPTRILFKTDDFGNLLPDGIVQVQLTGELRGMPTEKFILHTYQKEFDNYYGESDLRAAYRFWFLKVNFFRYWGMYLERFGIPLAIGKSGTSTLSTTDQEKFRKLVANLQAGMSAVLPKDLEIEFKEAARTDRGTFQQAIDACDTRIARAVLMPTLLGLSAGQDKGSLARSQTEESTFDMVLGGDTRSIQDALNEQLVRPLVEMNFGKQEEYPKFCFKPMREEDKKAFVVAWADAVSKQAAKSTIETDKHVRSLLGFPEMTTEEETAAKEAEKAGVALAAAALKGAPLPGKGKDKGNGQAPPEGDVAPQDGKQKVYMLTTLNAQEARKAWKDHVDQLDGLEEDSKSALSEAFSGAIEAMAIDSKKKS